MSGSRLPRRKGASAASMPSLSLPSRVRLARTAKPIPPSGLRPGTERPVARNMPGAVARLPTRFRRAGPHAQQAEIDKRNTCGYGRDAAESDDDDWSPDAALVLGARPNRISRRSGARAARERRQPKETSAGPGATGATGIRQRGRRSARRDIRPGPEGVTTSRRRPAWNTRQRRVEGADESWSAITPRGIRPRLDDSTALTRLRPR